MKINLSNFWLKRFNKIIYGKIHKGRLNCRINLIPKEEATSSLQVHEFRHVTETNFNRIFTGILSKRTVVKLLEKNKIMGENQAGVTKGMEMVEHLFTVQLIVSRQEAEFM